jgi:hypothetical protein
MGGAMVGEEAGNYVAPSAPSDTSTDDTAGSFPAGAAMCHKCNTPALVLMDGCQTCLNCGYSKCG